MEPQERAKCNWDCGFSSKAEFWSNGDLMFWRIGECELRTLKLAPGLASKQSQAFFFFILHCILYAKLLDIRRNCFLECTSWPKFFA